MPVCAGEEENNQSTVRTDEQTHEKQDRQVLTLKALLNEVERIRLGVSETNTHTHTQQTKTNVKSTVSEMEHQPPSGVTCVFSPWKEDSKPCDIMFIDTNKLGLRTRSLKEFYGKISKDCLLLMFYSLLYLQLYNIFLNISAWVCLLSNVDFFFLLQPQIHHRLINYWYVLLYFQNSEIILMQQYFCRFMLAV